MPPQIPSDLKSTGLKTKQKNENKWEQDLPNAKIPSVTLPKQNGII